MTRSTFLKSTVATVGSAGAVCALAGAIDAQPEYFEIRKYTLKSPEKQAILEAYLKDAAIPALNRLGVRHVGVFLSEKPETSAIVYVVLRHATLDSLAKSSALLADAELQQKGADYLAVPAAEAIFERVESWLTQGIANMPTMQLPPKGSQIYQLRIYESPSEQTAQKKVEMFNIGELEIFQRSGLNAVFFGATIIGPLMPNLTYMLAFSDAAAKEQAWNTFRSDPAWTKLKSTPGFTDKEIVSRITNTVLVPAACSQF